METKPQPTPDQYYLKASQDFELSRNNPQFQRSYFENTEPLDGRGTNGRIMSNAKLKWIMAIFIARLMRDLWRCSKYSRGHKSPLASERDFNQPLGDVSGHDWRNAADTATPIPNGPQIIEFFAPIVVMPKEFWVVTPAEMAEAEEMLLEFNRTASPTGTVVIETTTTVIELGKGLWAIALGQIIFNIGKIIAKPEDLEDEEEETKKRRRKATQLCVVLCLDTLGQAREKIDIYADDRALETNDTEKRVIRAFPSRA